MYLGYTLDNDEKQLRIVHRSLWSLAPAFSMSGFLLLFALGLMYLEGRYPEDSPFPVAMVLLIVGIVSLLAVAVFLIALFTYRRNVLVFTNKHLIEVEQSGLFSRSVSQVSFARVQDVTGSCTGFFPTIFNFGDVEVQSAGEQEKFIFHMAPGPDELADWALATHEQCMKDMAAAGTAPESSE